MSSSIPNLGVAELLISKFTGDEEIWVPMSSMDDLFIHVNGAGKEISAGPGERMFYFNTGYTLLGENRGEGQRKAIREVHQVKDTRAPQDEQIYLLGGGLREGSRHHDGIPKRT
jgi:hypothetical protein